RNRRPTACSTRGRRCGKHGAWARALGERARRSAAESGARSRWTVARAPQSARDNPAPLLQLRARLKLPRLKHPRTTPTTARPPAQRSLPPTDAVLLLVLWWRS